MTPFTHFRQLIKELKFLENGQRKTSQIQIWHGLYNDYVMVMVPPATAEDPDLCKGWKPLSCQGRSSVSADCMSNYAFQAMAANLSLGGRARGQKGRLKTESHFINTGGLVHIYNLSKRWWPWTTAICQQTHPSLGNELLEVMAQEPLRSFHPPSRTLTLGKRWHPGKERGVC